jgi:hypothetical protein
LLCDFAPLAGLFYLAAMCERVLSYGIGRGQHGVTPIKPAAGE